MSSDIHTQADNIKRFQANGLPTLIGSIPLTSHEDALDWIFDYTPNLPLWPQLPGNSLEGMLVQFLEGLPCVLEENNKTFFSTEKESFETEQLAFFEDYLQLSENKDQLFDSRFSVSRERAEGLYLLLERARDKKDILALKGQMTGPFTQLTGVSGQDKRAGYYNPTIREMVVKGLAMKAAWQVSLLKKLGHPAILFIDEPALAGLGSTSFLSISNSDIAADQTELIDATHQAGGLAGIHICANSDWALILSLGYDIINFDAYGFFESFGAFSHEIETFLARDGIIAWGLVPTSQAESIEKETPESLVALWERQAQALVNDNRDMGSILKQSLITPSCGTGSLSPELAKRVLFLTKNVSDILRKKYL
jgi:methionine synthase II (cobalamin-independent)